MLPGAALLLSPFCAAAAAYSCDAVCLQNYTKCADFAASQFVDFDLVAEPVGLARSTCRRESARCRAACRVPTAQPPCEPHVVPRRVPFIDGEDSVATLLVRWEGTACGDMSQVAGEWAVQILGTIITLPSARLAAIEHGRFTASLSLPLATLPLGLSTLQISDGLKLAKVQIIRAAPPAPGVTATVVDNLRGGLTRRTHADEEPLPVLPYGFYQYSIKKADSSLDHDFQLPASEATHSMNLVSPYASEFARSDADFTAMRSFLDRCAALGVLVHYQLIAYESLESNSTVLAALEKEINAFKDHPAILAWYLADEPDGSHIPPALFTAKYAKIKQLDPYHPVSMVFCSGGAKSFLASLDMIMVDPYPIPNSPASSVVNALDPVVKLGKPVIMVPQAFGGGENWKRAPSAQEERLMAYLGLLHGAIGWQYFVRSAPVSFPYAASAWGEVRKVAAEIAELTPAVLSGIKPPSLKLTHPRPLHPLQPLQKRAWQDRNGTVYVCIVNPAPTAVTATVTVPGVGGSSYQSPLVLFDMGLPLPYAPADQTSVGIADGGYLSTTATNDTTIDLTLLPFGTVVYRIEKLVPGATKSTAAAPATTTNMIYNPSYELAVNIGVPDGNYVQASADVGATFFADSRLSVEGLHSLRLSNPSNDSAGLFLAPYTLGTSSKHPEAGSYMYSIWARGAVGGEKLTFSFGAWAGQVSLKIACTTAWVKHSLYLNVTTASAKTCVYGCRSWLRYGLESQGVAWLDAATLTKQ